MSIINFNDINGGKKDSNDINGGGKLDASDIDLGIKQYIDLPDLIKMQTIHAKASYKEHLKIADMLTGINDSVKELMHRAGVNEPLIATRNLIQLVGRRTEDLIALSARFYGGKMIILCSDREKTPYYAVSLTLREKPRALPMSPPEVIPVVDLFRITRGKCEILGLKGWVRSGWRDYVGLTKEQWSDVSKDYILNEMMLAVIAKVSEPTDRLWDKIKKANFDLWQLCDIDDMVYRLVRFECFDHDDMGLPRLILRPLNKDRKGIAVGIKDGRLTLFLVGHTLYPVAAFKDVFEAADFIKVHYNKSDSHHLSVTIPLSKEKVIEIDDARSFSVYDFDSTVRDSFGSGSLTEEERNMVHSAKKAYVDIVTDDQLFDGLMSACINKFDELDEAIENLLDTDFDM